MNWLQLLLSLTPYVVVGVERIHADLSGPGKKQAAHDALTIATAAALQADPSDAAITQTASQLTGMVIDATVSDLKTKGVLPITAASTPAPTPAPAKVVPAPLPAAPEPEPAVATSPGLHSVVPA
jgi:hypothetical protein